MLNTRIVSSFCFIASFCALFASCKEKKEILSLEPLSDYIPLVVGKYITYRADSLVYTNFGSNIETHSYLIKHQISSITTDAMAQPTYSVQRYINADTSGSTNNWAPNGNYTITPTINRVEVVEDNLRFIKLQEPLRTGFVWKGNKYFPSDPYEDLNSQNNYDEGIQNWDYEYQDVESGFAYSGETYTDVRSVLGVDVAVNVPPTNNTQLSLRRKSLEKYSKGIGLVYREYILWERQPNSNSPYYLGFGITMWMVDHN